MAWHHLSIAQFLLYSIIAVTFSAAQEVIESASFGHRHGLSPDSVSLPGWDLSGSVIPQILSDKVLLVPPYPGKQQGALWTKERVSSPEWSVSTKFRTTGPEHGGGNFQIWYTKENQVQIGSSSLHTVDKFQGLVLVVDMHGGQGGGIRGFLNDGTMSFKNHHHLEQVAFGHCDYSYRNLGRPTRLEIKQDSTGFEVNVDDKRCFRSNDILLPTDNYFGITGASSDTPDSFEVFKFVATSLSSSTKQSTPPPPQAQQPMAERSAGKQDTITSQMMQDVLASSISSSQAQFEDLHNRIQTQGHNIDNLFSEYIKSTAVLQGRIEELHSRLARFDQVRQVEDKLASLEKEITGLRTDIKVDNSLNFNDLHAGMKARHDEIIGSLPDRIGHFVHSRGPRIGLWIFFAVGLQFASVGGYVWYKRRRDAAPKKYL